MPSSFLPFRPAVIAISLHLVCIGLASAQVAPAAAVNGAILATPTLPKEEAQVVNITGSAYDKRREDTASKIIVNRDDIDRYGDDNIADILKRLPSVTIGGVQGRGGDIRLRGLGSGYTQILLNGEPFPSGFSLDSISPGLIERIEVIRSGTAELSAQAIAGTINIILRKSVRKTQREVKLASGIQNGKRDNRVDVQLADKIKSLSYSLSANLSEGQFDRPANGTEVGTGRGGIVNYTRNIAVSDTGIFKNAQFVPRLSWSLDNGDTITAQSLLTLRQFSGSEIRVFQGRQNGNGDLFNGVNRDDSSGPNLTVRSSADWVHKLANGSTFNIKIGVNDHKRREDIDLVNSTDSNNNGGASNNERLERHSQSDYRDQSWSTSGKYLTSAVQDHAIAFGWDCERTRRNEVHSDIDTENHLRPVETYEKFNATLDRCAVFTQDEWSVNKNLAAYAGLRWEGVRTHSTGGDYSVQNRFSVLSPILQILWKIPGSKNDQVRLALSRTYKAPDAYKLTSRRYISFENSPANPDTTGNPNLRPELAQGLDAAFEHYFSAGGLISANIFVRRINDITITRLTNIDGLWLASPVNDGRANTHGIELEAKLPLRAFIKTAPAIEIRTNFSVNRSRLGNIPGPNNRLDSQTPFSGNLGLDYMLDQVPLTLGANFSFQNAGPVRILSTQINYASPKRVLDFYGLWHLDAKTGLRVSLTNVLHQNNVGSKIYFDGNGAFYQATTAQTFAQLRAVVEHKF